MAEDEKSGLAPIGGEGLQIKQEIAEDKKDVKSEPFDVGASSLGTDNEAGTPPDPDGMATARAAKQP